MDTGSRSLKSYALFAGFALGCAILLSQLDVKFAHPSQKEALKLQTLLPILLLGCLGAWLWGRAGLASKSGDGSSLRKLILFSVGAGLTFGMIIVVLDWVFGFSHLFASKIGVGSIHINFPHSALAYTAGAVTVESIYRVIPIPIGMWVISKLLLRGRGTSFVFWLLAVLTSLIEPVSQASLLRELPVAMICIGTFIFVFNLVQAWLMWRHGIAAPLIARIVFYALWHVILGPLVVA